MSSSFAFKFEWRRYTEGLLWRFMAWMVIFVTHRIAELERYAGLNNVATAALLFVAGKFIHPRFFMAVGPGRSYDAASTLNPLQWALTPL
jgi:hypothetical protein